MKLTPNPRPSRSLVSGTITRLKHLPVEDLIYLDFTQWLLDQDVLEKNWISLWTDASATLYTTFNFESLGDIKEFNQRAIAGCKKVFDVDISEYVDWPVYGICLNIMDTMPMTREALKEKYPERWKKCEAYWKETWDIWRANETQ